MSLGFLKDCPTGKLSRNEFIRIYIEFFPHGNPRNFAEWVFNVFDESNKGTICFSKFIRAVSITSHGSLGELKVHLEHHDIEKIFLTHAPKSLCDWLTLSDSLSD